MDESLICPHCRREHAEPADSRLGLHVPCADCALDRELDFFAAALGHLTLDPAERPAA